MTNISKLFLGLALLGFSNPVFASQKVTNCVLGAKIFSAEFNQVELEIVPHYGPGIALEAGKVSFSTGMNYDSATNGSVTELEGTRLQLLGAVAIDYPSATRTVYGVKLGLNPALAAKYNTGVTVLYSVCTEDETSMMGGF